MAKVNPIQLQKALKGTKYPAKKQALLDSAKTNGADDTIMSALKELPDSDFSRPSDVSKAVRGDAADAGASGGSGGSSRGAAKSEGKRSTASTGATGKASGGSKRQTNKDTTPSQAEGDRGTVERDLKQKKLQ